MSESSTTNQDPALVVTLTVGQLRQLVRQEVQTAVGQNGHGEERLLTAEEAAAVLSVSPDWLYRNAKKLPFTRRLGPKALRFSYQGIIKWLATRKPTN